MASTNAELQAEVDRLNAEAEAWAEENDALKAELEQAKRDAIVRPNIKPQPTEPSFGLTEGNRDELERLGRTISPFTGARLLGDGVGNVREVSQEEFDKHVKEHPAA